MPVGGVSGRIGVADRAGGPDGPEPLRVSAKGAHPLRFPHTAAALKRLRAAVRVLWQDYVIVRALRKRGWKRSSDWILVRRSDGHLFAPGAPQNFAYAMRGLFVRDHFHFYRVREWHGILIASRRVFWLPEKGAEFRFAFKCARFDLPAWPEAVECAKIDTHLAGAA